MDSGIKRIAIISSFAVVFLIVALVWYLDSEQDGRNRKRTDNSHATAEMEGNTEDRASYDPDLVGNDLSAFLKDDNFFDQEKDTAFENAAGRNKKLSLLVTSVEKDIRIQIVDQDGQPVSGTGFLVSVEGLGEFKDLDQDGIIYIGDLSAKEYSVELLPADGYSVPGHATRIRVKEKVEYIAISDISVLIKTERDIDAGREDTGTKDALNDADRTEIKELQASSQTARLGIDVSKWNGYVDWDKVKQEGIAFAIVRAGYRGSVSGAIVEDPSFQMNMAGASGALIQKGVYFFTQAVNEVEAVEEASAVLAWIQEYEITYPVFIDTEGGTAHLDVRRLQKPETWEELISLIRAVAATPDVCRSLVLDTADWAEAMAIDHICQKFSNSERRFV